MAIGIGVNAWVWTSPFDRDAVKYIATAASMGFDAFTMPIEEPALINVNAVRGALAEHPLRLNVSGAYGPGRDLSSADASARTGCLRYIHDMLKICDQLGVRCIGGPAYSQTGKRRKLDDDARRREWDRAITGLKEAGAMAADYGVTLALEPLNRFETDMVNTAEQVKRMVREVDLPSVKIHLDTFHMHIEEQNVYDAIILAGNDLVYFDASESDRGAPGSAQVDWNGVARALKEIGYQGDCVIESFTPACEAIADAACIWRPLASSQDALAEEGGKFLRKLLQS